MALFFSKAFPYRSMLQLQTSDCAVLLNHQNVILVLNDVADKYGFEPNRGVHDEYTEISKLYKKMFYQYNYFIPKNLCITNYYWDYSIDLDCNWSKNNQFDPECSVFYHQ